MKCHNTTQANILDEATTQIWNALDSFRLYSTRLGQLEMEARKLDEGRGRTIGIAKASVDARLREIGNALGSLEELYFACQALEESHQFHKYA